MKILYSLFCWKQTAEFGGLSACTDMNGSASYDLWVTVSGHVYALCTIKLPDILSAGYEVSRLIKASSNDAIPLLSCDVRISSVGITSLDVIARKLAGLMPPVEQDGDTRIARPEQSICRERGTGNHKSWHEGQEVC